MTDFFEDFLVAVFFAGDFLAAVFLTAFFVGVFFVARCVTAFFATCFAAFRGGAFFSALGAWTPEQNEGGRQLFWRAVVEIGFIVFLFYSNLLMGEFERSNQTGKTLSQGFFDIWTIHNFEIAIAAAIAGFIVFETLRGKAPK